MPELHANIDLDDSAVRLETVRSIWRDVLGVSEIEDDVTFLDAGGNSLLLVALVEKLSDACGRTLKTMDGVHSRGRELASADGGERW